MSQANRSETRSLTLPTDNGIINDLLWLGTQQSATKQRGRPPHTGWKHGERSLKPKRHRGLHRSIEFVSIKMAQPTPCRLRSPCAHHYGNQRYLTLLSWLSARSVRSQCVMTVALVRSHPKSWCWESDGHEALDTATVGARWHFDSTKFSLIVEVKQRCCSGVVRFTLWSDCTVLWNGSTSHRVDLEWYHAHTHTHREQGETVYVVAHKGLSRQRRRHSALECSQRALRLSVEGNSTRLMLVYELFCFRKFLIGWPLQHDNHFGNVKQQEV